MEDKTPIDDIKLTEIAFTKTKSPYPVTDGDGSWEGKNILGELFMDLRKELTKK